MTDSGMVEKSEPQDVSRRQQRANRILDAAETLILRWGYNKTTIDDIARLAGVAKGTIYLHWKTRESLFSALMIREKLRFAEDFKQHITADPEGATLRGIAKHSALAVLRRPLIKAVFLRDQEVLGKLAQSELSTTAYLERLAGFKAYLELMREQGLARTDLSLQAQVHIWSAISAGFFLASPMMPVDFLLPDEELADLMAETIHRTLEPDHPIPLEKYQAVFQIFIQYLNRTTATAEKQFQQETEVS